MTGTDILVMQNEQWSAEGTACLSPKASGARARTAGLLIALAAGLSTAHGHAQTIDQSLRLSLDSSVLAHQGTTLSADAAETKSSRTTFGLGAAGLGAGVGYGVTENVLLGGRVLALSSNAKVGDADASTSSVSVLPYVEYAFELGSARPFVALNAGYAGGSSSSAGIETSTSSWLLGPAAGVHVFALPSFSIDLGLQALLERGTSKLGDVSASTNGYSVGLTVSLSGWLATAPHEVATAERVQAPTASEAPDQATTALEASFTLDLPDRAGGVQVAIEGDPNIDAQQVRVTVTWYRGQEKSSGCGAPAFEVDGTATALVDVRSSLRGGFGAAMVAQRGSLPIEALHALVTSADESWLALCDQRVVVLPAAKRRLQRFVSDFRAHRSQP